MNATIEEALKDKVYTTESGVGFSRSDLGTAISVAMSEGRKNSGSPDGDAMRRCAEEMARAMDITYQEFRRIWAKYASDTRWYKENVLGIAVGKARASNHDRNGKVLVPKVVASDYDPFVDDDIVGSLIKEFSKVKPGQIVTQTFDTTQHATKIRGLMSRVSQKLGWKKYKTLLRNRVLYVKRIA